MNGKNLNGKKKFLCNSDFKKRVEKQRFFSSNHKSQIPN